MNDIKSILKKKLTYKVIVQQLKACNLYLPRLKRWFKYNIIDDIPKTIESIIGLNIFSLFCLLEEKPHSILKTELRNCNVILIVKRCPFGKFEICVRDYYSNEIVVKQKVDINQLISFLTIYIIYDMDDFFYDYAYVAKCIKEKLSKEKRFVINIF